jgi:hypothetical protein
MIFAVPVALLSLNLTTDPDGKVKTTRLSALLNAGLGYVADSRSSQGFIDFDAVPAGGCACVAIGLGKSSFPCHVIT